MFGWFAPQCPVDCREKTWTELRLRWMADQFGIDRLLNTETVLPTPQYFPDPYHESVDCVQNLFRRVCGYMRVDPGEIEVQLLPEEETHHLGYYQRGDSPVIALNESLLPTPEDLVATMAHELSHHILLGGKILVGTEEDHEFVTDLLPVFFGMGVFCANSTLTESSGHAGNVSWWSMGRSGYLNSRILGYGMGVLAWMRGEEKPSWAAHLRKDARSAALDGLRYLHKTKDSRIKRGSSGGLDAPHTAPDLGSQLAGERLAGLWELRYDKNRGAQFLESISQCLKYSDPRIRGEAACTLATLGEVAHPAVPQLIQCLKDRDDEVRASAAYALGACKPRQGEVVDEIAAVLTSPVSMCINGAATGLRYFGAAAERAVPQLLKALDGAHLECDFPTIDNLYGTLIAISSDPKKALSRHLAGDDPTSRQFALSSFKDYQQDLTEPKKWWHADPAPVPFKAQTKYFATRHGVHIRESWHL